MLVTVRPSASDKRNSIVLAHPLSFTMANSFSFERQRIVSRGMDGVKAVEIKERETIRFRVRYYFRGTPVDDTKSKRS